VIHMDKNVPLFFLMRTRIRPRIGEPGAAAAGPRECPVSRFA
jgi:hypothetical protein